MPNFLTKNLEQTAVYWAPVGPDGAGGFTYDEAVEVNCRREETSEMFIDAQGREKKSKAVYGLDTDVVVGGYLYLGSLDDLPSDTTDPFCDETKDGVDEIKSFKKIPRLTRPTEFFRKAWV